MLRVVVDGFLRVRESGGGMRDDAAILFCPSKVRGDNISRSADGGRRNQPTEPVSLRHQQLLPNWEPPPQLGQIYQLNVRDGPLQSKQSTSDFDATVA